MRIGTSSLLSACSAFLVLVIAPISSSHADQRTFIGVAALTDDGIVAGVAERFDRVLRVRPLAASGGSVSLPIWTELQRTSSGQMVTPWSIIGLVQDDSSLPVLFVASADEPPRFVVWLWHEWPSLPFMAFNRQRLGLTTPGETSLMKWGMPQEGTPRQRSACHWWSELAARPSGGDFLLIDEPQSEDSVGCLAAGLLRHVANPLWSHMARQFGGHPKSEALPEVRRLYGCALRCQFEFVRVNPLAAREDREKEDYLNKLGQRVRDDCVAKT